MEGLALAEVFVLSASAGRLTDEHLVEHGGDARSDQALELGLAGVDAASFTGGTWHTLNTWGTWSAVLTVTAGGTLGTGGTGWTLLAWEAVSAWGTNSAWGTSGAVNTVETDLAVHASAADLTAWALVTWSAWGTGSTLSTSSAHWTVSAWHTGFTVLAWGASGTWSTHGTHWTLVALASAWSTGGTSWTHDTHTTGTAHLTLETWSTVFTWVTVGTSATIGTGWTVNTWTSVSAWDTWLTADTVGTIWTWDTWNTLWTLWAGWRLASANAVVTDLVGLLDVAESVDFSLHPHLEVVLGDDLLVTVETGTLHKELLVPLTSDAVKIVLLELVEDWHDGVDVELAVYGVVQLSDDIGIDVGVWVALTVGDDNDDLLSASSLGLSDFALEELKTAVEEGALVEGLQSIELGREGLVVHVLRDGDVEVSLLSVSDDTEARVLADLVVVVDVSRNHLDAQFHFLPSFANARGSVEHDKVIGEAWRWCFKVAVALALAVVVGETGEVKAGAHGHGACHEAGKKNECSHIC